MITLHKAPAPARIKRMHIHSDLQNLLGTHEYVRLKKNDLNALESVFYWQGMSSK